MTIKMNSLSQFLRDVFADTGVNPVCIKCYRAASDSEIKDLQGVFYMNTSDTVRGWDDTDESGEQYNVREFFAGCFIWGIDLNDHYENEDVVTVYIYREGL